MGVKLIWRSMKSGSRAAYLHVHLNGKEHRKSLKIVIKKGENGKEKRRLAEKAKAKYELQILNQDHGFEKPKDLDMCFISYYRQYIKDYTKTDFRKVKYSLSKFLEFTGRQQMSFKSVTPILCEGYMNHLKDKSGLSGETPYMYWKKFKGVLKHAKKAEIINSNPADDIKFVGYNKGFGNLNKEIVTFDELKILINTRCGNEEVKKAFIFSCFTGLGRAELTKLKWDDIRNGKMKMKRGKSSVQVWNDLHPYAAKLIGEGSEGFVFKELPSEQSVQKSITAWMKRANIKKHISFYCGRHSFGILLFDNGADLLTVSKLMGHRSVRHTLKYLNYIDKHKSEAISAIPDPFD